MTPRIGISVTSVHDVVDPHVGARHMIERARAARGAGLDSLFVGDHHSTPKPYYQNSVILGRMLAEWGDRPFGALYLLPLWHPLIVAEQVGTLASLGSGRFILQCAIGPRDAQFAAMGVDPRHRPSRFEESLDVLRRLWRGEEVSSNGRYRLEKARVNPRPSAPVEVWIGATAPAAIERAARLGDGWLATPSATVQQAEEQLSLYREACNAAGRPAGVAAIRRDLYVASSPQDASEVSQLVERSGHRGFPREAIVCDVARGVAETFRQLGDMGYSDIIVRNLYVGQERALGSIDRLAEVRSRLNG